MDDRDLDKLAEITEEDVLSARDRWPRVAPRGTQSFLTARSVAVPATEEERKEADDIETAWALKENARFLAKARRVPVGHDHSKVSSS